MHETGKQGKNQLVIIVIPTYNERENLPKIIGKIINLHIPNLRLLIVDDNSPDKTGEVAEDLAKQYPISVIHRKEKAGLGTAYLHAFREIVSRYKNEVSYVIQMDADLSHDPAAIPELLNVIKEFDVVIGSRYVKGGKTKNWNTTRKLISRFGNIYARTILGVPYKDITSGFKCYRYAVIEDLAKAGLSSVGYNFQIETIYKAHTHHWRIKEIPILFTEREDGVSKFNLKIILESFGRVLLLRFKKPMEVISGTPQSDHRS